MLPRARLAHALVTALLVASAAAAGTAGSHSANETKLVFSRGDINVGTAIWKANGNGSELGQITRPPKAALDNEPVWSPDRSRIAFVRAIVVGEDFSGDFIHREHLTVMNAEGSALRRLAVHSHGPAWSPDGKQIAFVKNYADDEWIWTIKPDGRDARRIAKGGDPSWSPDGRRIAFSRYLGGVSQGEVFVMNSDGTGQHRLLRRNYESLHPAWSPDGRRIAFLGFSPNGLYVVRASGVPGTAIRLAGGVSTKDNAEPEWSPDGRRVLFEREGPGGFDSTFVINSAGGGLRRLATDTDYPEWSPDGRSMAFARYSRALFVLSAAGGQPRVVARGDVRDVDW